MTRASDSTDSPLAADDPRISEWLDGRLPPAAAAEVERAVRGSPELTRLVDDLRAIRGALRGLPVAEPPAGFSGRVMAAAEQPSRAAAGDREREQSPVGDGPRRRPGIWRAWPALAAALAAGMLVTIVLNVPALLPIPGDREVALGPALQETADDAWTPANRELEKKAARVAAAPAPAPGRPAADEYASREADLSRQDRSNAGLRTANEEAGEALGAETAKADALAMAVAGVLAIEVGTASSRRALDRLVAASGLEATRAGERLELVGSAAATNAFLAELERAGLLQASSRREAKGFSSGGDQPMRLIIRLVEPKPIPDEGRP